MDSQAIGSVTSTGTTSPAQLHAQGTRTAKALPDSTVTRAAHQHEQQQKTAEAVRAEEAKVPQRDPRSLQYQVDGATHRVVATIIDDGSKTVVRQIPDAEILRIAQAIDRMQGFLVEEKA